MKPSTKLFSLLVSLLFCTVVFSQKIVLNQFKNLKARSIGPAGMSGRVTSIDAVITTPPADGHEQGSALLVGDAALRGAVDPESDLVRREGSAGFFRVNQIVHPHGWFL